MTNVKRAGTSLGGCLGLGCALLLTGASSHPSGNPWGGAAAVLTADGIGPLRVGASLERAERLAARLAPAGFYSGPGCAGLEEIRYDIRLGDAPVGVMAMASDGWISEVEVSLHTPTRADTQGACVSLRDDFAQPFLGQFGPYVDQWQIDNPVSTELVARTGPVMLAARWFATGQTCYVSARFGPPPD